MSERGLRDERQQHSGPRSICVPHAWRVSAAEGAQIQVLLRERVEQTDRFAAIERVGGLDLGFFSREDGAAMARAVVVVLAYPGLEQLESVEATVPVEMPYIPGLLSFREGPAALAALERLERLPDLLLVDGQGRAHPRRFGIACHLGVLADLPTVGVAKSPLSGRADAPGEEFGAYTCLQQGDEVLGACVRTRSRTAPVYVSVGHRVSLETAIRVVLNCARGHRLPEPTFLADRLASRRGAVRGSPAGRGGAAG